MPPGSPARGIPLLQPAARCVGERGVRDPERLAIGVRALVPGSQQGSQRRPAAGAVAPGLDAPAVLVDRERALAPAAPDEPGSLLEQPDRFDPAGAPRIG